MSKDKDSLEIHEKIDVLFTFSEEFHEDRSKALQNALNKSSNDQGLKKLLTDTVEHINQLEKSKSQSDLDYFTLPPDEIQAEFDKIFTEYSVKEAKKVANEYFKDLSENKITQEEVKEKLKESTQKIFDTHKKHNIPFEEEEESKENTKNEGFAHKMSAEEQEKSSSNTVDLDDQGIPKNANFINKEKKTFSFPYTPEQQFDEIFNRMKPEEYDYKVNKSFNPIKDKEFQESLDENHPKSMDGLRDLSTRILKEVKENPKNTNFEKIFNDVRKEYSNEPDTLKEFDGLQNQLQDLANKKKKYNTEYEMDWSNPDVIFSIKSDKKQIGEDDHYSLARVENLLSKTLLDSYSSVYDKQDREAFKEKNKERVHVEVAKMSETNTVGIDSKGIAKDIDTLNKDLKDKTEQWSREESQNKQEIPVQMEDLKAKDVNTGNKIREEILNKEKDLSALIGAVKVHGLETEKGMEAIQNNKKSPASAVFYKGFKEIYDDIKEKASKPHLNTDKQQIYVDLIKDIDKLGTEKAMEKVLARSEKYKDENPEVYSELKSLKYDLSDLEKKAYSKSADGVFKKYADKNVSTDKSKSYTGSEVNHLIKETLVELTKRDKTGKTPNEILEQAWKKNEYKDIKVTEGLNSIFSLYQKNGLERVTEFKKSEEKGLLKEILKDSYNNNLDPIDLKEHKDKNGSIDKVIDKEISSMISTGKLTTASVEGNKAIKDKRTDINSLSIENEKSRLKNVQKSLAFYEREGISITPGKKAYYEKEVEVDININNDYKKNLAALEKHFPNFKLEEHKHKLGHKTDQVLPNSTDKEQSRNLPQRKL